MSHPSPRLDRGLTRLPACGTLPSSTAAWKFVNGEPGGFAGIVGSTLGRAALIAAGVKFLTDDPEPLRKGMAGALGIEVFVLLYAASQRGRCRV